MSTSSGDLLTGLLVGLLVDEEPRGRRSRPALLVSRLGDAAPAVLPAPCCRDQPTAHDDPRLRPSSRRRGDLRRIRTADGHSYIVLVGRPATLQPRLAGGGTGICARGTTSRPPPRTRRRATGAPRGRKACARRDRRSLTPARARRSAWRPLSRRRPVPQRSRKRKRKTRGRPQWAIQWIDDVGLEAEPAVAASCRQPRLASPGRRGSRSSGRPQRPAARRLEPAGGVDSPRGSRRRLWRRAGAGLLAGARSTWRLGGCDRSSTPRRQRMLSHRPLARFRGHSSSSGV